MVGDNVPTHRFHVLISSEVPQSRLKRRRMKTTGSMSTPAQTVWSIVEDMRYAQGINIKKWNVLAQQFCTVINTAKTEHVLLSMNALEYDLCVLSTWLLPCHKRVSIGEETFRTGTVLQDTLLVMGIIFKGWVDDVFKGICAKAWCATSELD